MKEESKKGNTFFTGCRPPREGERPIFGNVRYMNDKGLKRKFDADGYVKMIDASATAL
jgi:hypothetical protein